MRKLEKVLFVVALFFGFVYPLNADCHYNDDNVQICEDVGGDVSGGMGGPAGQIDTKNNFWSTNVAVMTKFSLVNQNTLEVKGVYYYASFSQGNKTYGKNFASSTGNAAGAANYVCGFISGGQTTADCADVYGGNYNIKGISYGNENNFIVVKNGNQFVSTKRLEDWMKNEGPGGSKTSPFGKEGWFNLYGILGKLGMCDVPEFGLAGKCTSEETLQAAIKEMTAKQNAEISQYLVIAEPVYANKTPNVTTPIMYSTLKGTAKWMAQRTPAGETRGISKYISTIHQMLKANEDHGLIKKYNGEFADYGRLLTKEQWEALSDATNGSQYNIWALSTIFKIQPKICQIADVNEDGIPEYYGRYGQELNNEDEMIEDCSCFIENNQYYLNYWLNGDWTTETREDPVSPEKWQEVCEPIDKFVCPPKEIDYDEMIDDCEDNSGVGNMKDPEICRIINREHENNLDHNYITDYGHDEFCKIFNRETLEFTFMEKETAIAGQHFSHSVKAKHLSNGNLSTVILSTRQAASVINYEKWKAAYTSANNSVLSTWNNLKYWESLYNLAGGSPTKTEEGGGCKICACEGAPHPTFYAEWKTGYWIITNDDGSTSPSVAEVTQTGTPAKCTPRCCYRGCGKNGTACCNYCCGTCTNATSADLDYVRRNYNSAIRSYEGALDERDRLMYILMDCNMMNSKDSIYTNYISSNSNNTYHVSNGKYHTTTSKLTMYDRFLQDFPDPTVDMTYEEQDYSYEFDLSEANLVKIEREVSEPIETSRTFSKEEKWADYCDSGVESEEACQNDLGGLSSSSYNEPLKYWLCSGTGGTCTDIKLTFPINTIVNITVDKEFGYYQDEDFYTQVYTGQLRNSPSSLGYWIELENHIWPVGVKRLTGDYDINVTYDNINATNRRIEFETSDLLCRYHVINDLANFKCDDSHHECYDCVGSDDCETSPDPEKNLSLGVYFRTIDLNDIFPNSQYSRPTTISNPLHRRNIGKNWINEKDVIDDIQDLGDKVYATKPIQYKVTLTPAAIKLIQKSNKLKEGEGGYLDFSLINCGSSLHCESNFLKNELKDILGNKYEDLYKTNTRTGLYDYRR